jgi:methyl-accepting chemotaxis protein
MFIFVWQPIWTEGFKDFHTISNAIDKLDKTAQPASDTIPLMLAEMVKMNKSMNGMQNIMREMNGSMENIEQMTPDIKRMTHSVDQMTVVMSNEMTRMTYLMGRIQNKIPSMNFMP